MAYSADSVEKQAIQTGWVREIEATNRRKTGPRQLKIMHGKGDAGLLVEGSALHNDLVRLIDDPAEHAMRVDVNLIASATE